MVLSLCRPPLIRTTKQFLQKSTPWVCLFAMASTSQAFSSSSQSSCTAGPQGVVPIDAARSQLLQDAGIMIEALEPLGAKVTGIDLKSSPPSEEIRMALEAEMASRGYVVFKGQRNLSVDQLINCSVWWGGREMLSTHGVHPATPDYNRHIFRLSNDRTHGILGVGPQWHNDGSFEPGTFSHVGYYIVRVPEKGGGTYFSHQGAAFDSLPPERQELWERLSSVNSNSGVVHPCVHTHPISGRKSVWLHLGMTGAVIQKTKDEDGFRLLNESEMKVLFHEYNDLLNDGLEKGYTTLYEYEDGDCIFIDNLAVAHRASPEAHLPASVQGLRILHRTTVKPVRDFAPGYGLPQYMNIHAKSPFGKGVWQGGGIGFRWDENIKMQN